MRLAAILTVALALSACGASNRQPSGTTGGSGSGTSGNTGGSSGSGDTGGGGTTGGSTGGDTGGGSTGGGSTGGGSTGGGSTGGDTGGGPAIDPCAEVATSASDSAAYDDVLACVRGNDADAKKSAAVSTFFTVVEGRDGFPIESGNDVIFAGIPENGGPGVAGDFNGWQPAAFELDGNGLMSVRIAIPAEQRAGAKYKFVNSDTGYHADPLARRFQFDDNGEFSIVMGATNASHLERIANVHATKLGNDRPIYLYVPAGYEGSTDHYPVLYMHDGQNLFDARMPNAAPVSWEADAVADSEIGAGNAKPFLIVGIPNDDNRFGEYTFNTDDIGGGQVVGGQGADYADFIVHDLKPEVDRRYRTLTDKAHTGVLGSSLGGLLSYEIGLLFPDVFGMVGGMSSTFDWGTIGLQNPTCVDRYNASTSLATSNQIFYLDSGGAPPASGTCPGSDGDNYCATIAMKQALESKGFNTYPADPNAAHISPANANIEHWWEPNQEHNESSWNSRVFRVFRFFFRT